jgi:ABC-type multidrug transport system fused ATPase/permease subunit
MAANSDLICSEFAETTELNIAHRLTTVSEYDRILMFDADQVVEFDAPQDLMRKGFKHSSQISQKFLFYKHLRL